MKSTGDVRRLHGLGRFVVPVALRRRLGIGKGDGVEVWVEDGSIMLRKYQPGCVICGGTTDLQHYKAKVLCSACVGSLTSMASMLSPTCPAGEPVE